MVLSESHVIPRLAAFLISPRSPPKFLIENTRYFQIEAEFSRKGTSSIMFVMDYEMVFLVRSPMLKVNYFLYFFLKQCYKLCNLNKSVQKLNKKLLKQIHFCEKDVNIYFCQKIHSKLTYFGWVGYW